MHIDPSALRQDHIGHYTSGSEPAEPRVVLQFGLASLIDLDVLPQALVVPPTVQRLAEARLRDRVRRPPAVVVVVGLRRTRVKRGREVRTAGVVKVLLRRAATAATALRAPGLDRAAAAGLDLAVQRTAHDGPQPLHA